jgi:hypothetical protein
MKSFTMHAVFGLSLAIGSTASYAAPPRSCASLLQTNGIGPRQLYMLPSGAPLEPERSLKHQSSLALAYIVPAHEYSSGVVILKVRHHVLSTTPPAADSQRISMSRPAYRTPCTGKADPDIGGAEYDPDVAQYRNYHLNQLPDAQMDRVHADLGNRPKGWWGESDNRCVSTSSWDIRPQLLFEDSISDRQVIGVIGYFGNRVATAIQAPKVNETAVAAPIAYSTYRDLTVRIIPYRKSSDQFACVNLAVGSVPISADWTDIMIIDADDAKYPREPFVDPQRSWRLRWN